MNIGKIVLVAQREYIFNFRRPSFLFTAFGFPILIFGIMYFVFNFIIDSETRLDDWQRIAFVDYAGIVVRNDDEHNPDGYAALNETEAHAQLLEGKLDGYFVIARDYVTSGQVIFVAEKQAPAALLNERIPDFLRRQIAAGVSNLDAIEPRLREDLETDLREVQSGETVGEIAIYGRFMVPFIFVFIYFMATSTTAQFMMSGVVEEKENRLMEVLATSLRPIELLTGKIVGLVLLSLTQVAFWVLGGIGIALMNDDAREFLSGVGLTPGEVLLLVALFVLNFLLFASMMLAIGAAVTAESESRQVAGFFTFILVIPFIFLSAYFEDPNGTLPVVLTFIPLTTSMSLILRLGISAVPLWQVVNALGIQIIFTMAVLWLAAKIFRMGMLMYGKMLTPGEIVRALREDRAPVISTPTGGRR